jgi:hypothetical protein
MDQQAMFLSRLAVLEARLGVLDADRKDADHRAKEAAHHGDKVADKLAERVAALETAFASVSHELASRSFSARGQHADPRVGDAVFYFPEHKRPMRAFVVRVADDESGTVGLCVLGDGRDVSGVRPTTFYVPFAAKAVFVGAATTWSWTSG